MERLRVVAGVLAAGLLACLPNPQSVKERREEFPRDGLRGELLFDELPAGAQPVGAVFGDWAELAGYSLDPPNPTPGTRVTITFYWKALKVMPEDYEVFVHGDAIGGSANRLHGDHFPAKGKYPTDVWQVGEIVADPFTMFIPPGYGPKVLGIYTGLYKDSYRVPLTNRGMRPGMPDNRSLAIEIRF